MYRSLMRLLYGRHFHDRYRSIAAEIAAGCSVVDVCCGDCCLYLGWLKAKGVSYVGLDLSAGFVAWASKRGVNRCPHTAQAGIKMEFAFVLEEECVSVGSGSHFFKAAVLLHLARRTSFGSCLCLRDNFGRL